MKLEGRVALVTGASQGIGHACALELAREGATVAVAARNQQKLEELVATITASGGKAAAFVSYGSVSGARSVQQLRQVLIELQMAPIRPSVHIPVATLWAHFQDGDVGKGLAELETPAKAMIDDLLWWTSALKTARSGS